MAGDPQGKFLTGSTFRHLAYMMLTSALGITFIFIVDAANLFWISQLGDPQMIAAIGYAFTIQFFSVSTGIGMMIAATALVARSIGQKAHVQARQQATAGMIVTTIVQACIAAFIIGFRHDLLALVGAPMIPQHWRRVIWR